LLLILRLAERHPLEAGRDRGAGGCRQGSRPVSERAYLIDASAYWRIDRGAVLASAWRDHLERGLVWICPPTEMEICRRASKDQHTVHLREFTDTYVRV
jgi:hypothetical protein